MDLRGLAILGAAVAWAMTAAAAAPLVSDCAGCPQMVVLAPATFEMGGSAEEHRWYGVPDSFARQELPRHTVTLARPFAIGRAEVTRAQYARFVAATGRADDPKGCSAHDAKTDAYGYKAGLSWREPGVATGDDYPVSCVTWGDAAAYADWMSKTTGHRYRLPSEAEWEYAARGGATTAAYWGDNPEAMCAAANIMNGATYEGMGAPPSWRRRLMCSGSPGYTAPVGGYPPNPFGLSDMIGNVWEWTQDCAHPGYDSAPVDGSAREEPGCQKRSIRGGAFHSAPYFGRSAARGNGQAADHLSQAIGFRVARDMDSGNGR